MFETFMDGPFWLALLQIAGINILLSGDNAVVIALACRSLPDGQRNKAVLGGSIGAILLRLVFSLVVVWLLEIPYLKLVGGALLLWIGVRLMVPESGANGIAGKANLWGAIRTIVIADAVMSLDNVVAIAAVAKGSMVLIGLGLLMSVPLIIFGSQLVLALLNRFPILVAAGAGLLGWLAGEIMSGDPAVTEWTGIEAHRIELVARPVLALAVVALGTLLARRVPRAPPVDLVEEERR